MSMWWISAFGISYTAGLGCRHQRREDAHIFLILPWLLYSVDIWYILSTYLHPSTGVSISKNKYSGVRTILLFYYFYHFYDGQLSHSRRSPLLTGPNEVVSVTSTMPTFKRIIICIQYVLCRQILKSYIYILPRDFVDNHSLQALLVSYITNWQ